MEGPHPFFSRNWHDTNWTIEQGLGESLDANQKWDRGDKPAVMPLNQRIGTAACFSQGESIANAIGSDQMENGFPLTCYTPHREDIPHWNEAGSFEICSIQFFYSTIIQWMYEGHTGRIIQAFDMLLGPLAVVHWHRGNYLMPDVVIVTTPDFTVVVTNGTATYAQWAVQAFYTISLPASIGLYSTLPIWYGAATYILGLIAGDGGNMTGPIFLCGHSYGGVANDNVIARLLAANPNRVVRYLTFGSPKPGNRALQRILSIPLGMSMVNETDLVPSLPPDTEAFDAFQRFIGVPGLFNWASWFAEPNRARQDINGLLTLDVNPVIDFPTLQRLYLEITLAQPLTGLGPHSILDYRQRIETRCPIPEWPVSDVLWAFLHGINIPFVGLQLGETANMAGMEIGNEAPDPTQIDGYLRLGSVETFVGLDVGIEADKGPSNLEVGSVETFVGLEVGVIIPPVITMLEIGSEESFAGMGIGSTDTPPNCPCCTTLDAPVTFTVLMTCPGYAFDGQHVTENLVIMAGSCNWNGTNPGAGVSLQVFSNVGLGAGFVEITWYAIVGPFQILRLWPSTNVVIPLTSCNPWSFTLNCEIALNFVPTGDFITITVSSIP